LSASPVTVEADLLADAEFGKNEVQYIVTCRIAGKGVESV
jgi:hypothetical protein